MIKYAPGLKNLFVTTALAVLATSAAAEPIYGITDGVTSSLVMFDSTSPALLTTIGTVTGVTAGQTLRAVDFRPSDGRLYAVSSFGTAAQLYTINLATGALTAIGSGFTLTDNTSTRVSIDFNPVANALRVVTGNGQNYRVNANTGAVIAQDTTIGSNRLIADVAYTNNVVGATSTTLYAYDFSSDVIGTIGSVGGTPVSPNSGQFMNVGQSGVVSVNAAVGFDISGLTGIAYLSLDANSSPNSNSEFYTVNLATGAASLVGTLSVALLDFSVGVPVVVAAVPEPESLGLLAIGLLSLGFAARRRRTA